MKGWSFALNECISSARPTLTTKMPHIQSEKPSTLVMFATQHICDIKDADGDRLRGGGARRSCWEMGCVGRVSRCRLWVARLFVLPFLRWGVVICLHDCLCWVSRRPDAALKGSEER
jgi:hypothetical protein